MHIGRAITYDNIKRAEKKIGYRKRSTGRGKPWKMHPPDCECGKC